MRFKIECAHITPMDAMANLCFLSTMRPTTFSRILKPKFCFAYFEFSEIKTRMDVERSAASNLERGTLKIETHWKRERHIPEQNQQNAFDSKNISANTRPNFEVAYPREKCITSGGKRLRETERPRSSLITQILEIPLSV